MQLRVTPDELAVAAGALRACGARLDDAVTEFGALAHTDLGQLGSTAADAAQQSTSAARAAAEVIVSDVTALAQALHVLAVAYARTDSGAVRR